MTASCARCGRTRSSITDPAQLEFKRQTDPKGLLNPGKMIAWTHPDWVPAPGRIFLFNR